MQVSTINNNRTYDEVAEYLGACPWNYGTYGLQWKAEAYRGQYLPTYGIVRTGRWRDGQYEVSETLAYRVWSGEAGDPQILAGQSLMDGLRHHFQGRLASVVDVLVRGRWERLSGTRWPEW